jgi:hypothetical protein
VTIAPRKTPPSFTGKLIMSTRRRLGICAPIDLYDASILQLPQDLKLHLKLAPIIATTFSVRDQTHD